SRHLDLKTGDAIVVEGGVGGYGRSAYVAKDLPEYGFQNSIIRIRPKPGWSGKFLTYALLLLRKVGYIATVSSVSSMPHFTAEKVADTPTPNVSLAEQNIVVKKLNRTWEASEALFKELHTAIELSQERWSALISAAVSGQIDVS